MRVKLNKSFLVVLLICFLPAIAYSQQVEDPKEQKATPETVDLSTPKKAVSAHLIYLQQDNFRPDLSAQTLNPIQMDNTVISLEDLEDLAQDLKQIYDGSGYFVDPTLIPDTPNYIDSTQENQNIYRISDQWPDIYLTLENGKWRYSQRTVAAIPRLHKKLYPLGTDFLVSLIPAYGNVEILGLKLWQYIGFILIILLCYLFYWVLLRFSRTIIQRVMPLIGSRLEVSAQDAIPVAKPLSAVLVLMTAALLIPSLQLPVKLSFYVTQAFTILIPLALIIMLLRISDLVGILLKRVSSYTDTTMDDQLVPLVRKGLKIIIVAIGLIFILDNMGVNITALLAGASIGGLALALAAQDTAKNLIGSLTIFVDRPFQIGDFIATDKVTGSVKEVGIRSTRILALDGAQVSIPNGELANLTITNHGIRTYRRYSTTITIMYNTPPNKVEEFVNAIRDLTNDHPKTRDDATVYFHEMSSSSLDIFFAAFFLITDFGEWLEARQDVFLSILRKAEELGVGFAYPSSSLYIEKFPHMNGMKAAE